MYYSGHPGSSPLTRGKPPLDADQGEVLGLIPAHAGKTRASTVSLSVAGAHPRSRGENGHRGGGRFRRPGSSPLTRGKPRRPFGDGVPVRLIPAHAGKTEEAVRGWRAGQAHPRSRGENSSPSWSVDFRFGSSPLTRGKRAGHFPHAGCGRLIPAHAGKTIAHTGRAGLLAAHPRSRGENLMASQATPRRSGSSPLTRGKRAWVVAVLGTSGLIPAHAGKTLVGRALQVCDRAHPRSRGENPLPSLVGGLLVGSSPLTRGKRRHGWQGRQRLRLIPAHAGKTTPY